MADDIKPNSKITLYNKQTGTSSNIVIEKVIPGKDVTLAIKPTDNNYITVKRLENIKTAITSYMSSPSIEKTISTPVISSYEQNDLKGIFKITPYKSNIMLPYVGVEYVIYTKNRSAQETIVESKLIHNYPYNNGLIIDVSNLTTKRKYYIKMRYLGGGYSSNYSSELSFTPTFPTISQPSISSVVYTYGDTLPYRTTVNVSSSPFQPNDSDSGMTHIASTWKIYKKIKDGYDVIWTSQNDAINLTSITINNLIPSKISHNDEFFISVIYHGSGSAFSKESELASTQSNGIIVSPSNILDVYPIEINTYDLTFIVDNEYVLKIGDRDYIQSIAEIENFQWELEYFNGETVVHNYSTKENKLQINNGEIVPDKEYKIRCRYKHKVLGYSAFKEKTFKTAKLFISSPDKLSIPIKTYNSQAYFGEISYEHLMSETVRYRGKFDSNESYTRGDEVNKDGILYVCVRDGSGVNFDKIFKPISHASASSIYNSGLPKVKWLLDNIGLNYYLNDNGESLTSDITDERIGWIKVRNDRGQILYITKKNILNNISINDLIDKDLFHPRRKTIRIGGNLYYIRILVHDLEVGYDTLDPLYTGDNFNVSYRHSDPISYNEDSLLINLMNSKLATYDPNDLDIPTEYKEIIYNIDNIYGYKSDQSGGSVGLNKQILPYADERTLKYRAVLELIPPENHPYRNISKSLPGVVDSVEDGEFNPLDYYDPYVDAGYLGYVRVEDFITSETIDLQTGLFSDKHLPILGWFKIYYRGLIYFIPNGTTFKNVTYDSMDKFNLVTPTPRYMYNVSSDKIKFGKVFVDNKIYNVCCPDVLKFTSIRETVIINNKRINLFENVDPKLEPDFCYDTFLSDVIYGLIPVVKVNRQLPGYKGKFKRLKYLEAMKQFGSGDSETSSFLTGNVIRYIDGSRTVVYPIVNNQKTISRIEKKTTTDLVDAICCLTINPIFDKPELW